MPKLLELAFVAQRVHRPPEIRVLEGDELALGRQSLERGALPDGVVPVDVRDDGRVEHKKAAVDPTHLLVGLFAEAAHAERIVKLQNPEAAGRRHCRNGSLLGVRAVEVDDVANLYPGQAIAIRHAERFVPEVLGHAPEAPPRHGFGSGVYEGHFPGLVRATVETDSVRAEIDSDVIILSEVIHEIILNHRPLVAAADDEIVETSRSIQLHDVP